MGYRQLSIEERCEIARLRAAGASRREIARCLDRSPSTVSRELNRNASRSKGYQPSYAHERAWGRRWTGSRLERHDALRERVLALLAFGHSPEQAAHRLAREDGRPVISHETIYRFIFGQIARTKEYAWRRYLPKAKWRRGRRRRKGGSSAAFIRLRRSIAERPHEADDRQTFGHWEADTMLFGRSGPVALVLHERASRLTLALRLASKDSTGVAAALTRLLERLPPELRPTVTFDNGRSSHATTNSTTWASRPSSATPMRLGRREAWSTRSADCGASCPARRIWRRSRRRSLRSCSSRTTIRRASASAGKPQPRSSTNRCCTSNVNAPSRFRGNDGSKAGNDGGKTRE